MICCRGNIIMTLRIVVLNIVTPYGSVDCYKQFGGLHCLYHQGRRLFCYEGGNSGLHCNHGACLPAWHHTPEDCNANINCCDNLHFKFFFEVVSSPPLAFVPFPYFPLPLLCFSSSLSFFFPPFSSSTLSLSSSSSSSSSSSWITQHQASQFSLQHLLVHRNKLILYLPCSRS